MAKFKNFPLCKIVEIKIDCKTRLENILKLVYLKDSNAASPFVNSLILFALSRTA